MENSVRPDYGPRPELTWLHVKSLTVDLAYQRTLESKRSEKAIVDIAAKFRWSCFGTVLVCPAGDGWLIIDGQHRVEAARRLGIPTVPCIVVPEASVAQQAEIFLSTNLTRVSVNIYALFHARLAAQDATALRTLDLCSRAGLSIPRYPIPVANLKRGQTLALKTLEAVARSENPVAEAAVIAIGRTIGQKPGGASASIIQGVLQAAAVVPDKLADIEAYLAASVPEALNNQYRGTGGALRLAGAICQFVTGKVPDVIAAKVQPSVALPAPPPVVVKAPASADPLKHVVDWMFDQGLDVKIKGGVYFMNGRIRMSPEDLIASANRRRQKKGLPLFSLGAAA